MNTYAKTERQRRHIDRQHFILFHWVFFPECRRWTPGDWHTRLKEEGLLARSTYHLDTPSVTKLLIDLHHTTLK